MNTVEYRNLTITQNLVKYSNTVGICHIFGYDCVMIIKNKNKIHVYACTLQAQVHKW